MGKNSDKLYVTRTEWIESYGGAKVKKNSSEFKRLPFNCCVLSLRPAESPVCTEDGTVFDLVNAIPWIKKHGTNPVNCKPLTRQELIPLHLHKSANGEYHCPVTFKVFNDHSHIVAIKTTGNVFSFEAVNRLNIKANNYRDLINDEPFTRKDVITLQDPLHLEKQNITQFDYVKKGIQPEKSEKTISFQEKPKNSKDTLISTNKTAMSFTSTAMPLSTATETIIDSDLEHMFKTMPKGSRGYATIETSMGDFNVELYCHEAPRTCYNFIELSKRGDYNSTLFHRLIPSFMIQGGSTDEQTSIFGTSFEDEIHKTLKHDSRGILSMANKGPHTNSTQFFFLYKASPHLDRKHTVFGKIVSNFDWLDRTEAVDTLADDRPKKQIAIFSIKVYKDPFVEYAEKEKKAAESSKQRLLEKEQRAKRRLEQDTWLPSTGPIGKYLKK